MQARMAEDGEQIARARRQDLHARFVDVRDRRRERGARHRRRHGRRGDRLHRSHHQRLRRIGLFRSGVDRSHGPQARHPFGRALPLRARRRSGIRGAGPGARDQADPRILRRRALRDRGRRRGARLAAPDRFHARRREAPGRPRPAAREITRILANLGFTVERWHAAEGHPAVLAQRCRRLGRSGRGNRAHPRPRACAVGADGAARRHCAAGSDRGPAPFAHRAPHLGRARLQRDRLLFLHSARTRLAVRRRRRSAPARKSHRRRSRCDAALACCRRFWQRRPQPGARLHPI